MCDIEIREVTINISGKHVKVIIPAGVIAIRIGQIINQNDIFASLTRPGGAHSR